MDTHQKIARYVALRQKHRHALLSDEEDTELDALAQWLLALDDPDMAASADRVARRYALTRPL